MKKIGILVHKLSLKTFYIILFIYWCLIATIDPDKAIVKYSSIYWLYVSPVFLLLVVFFANFLFNYKKYFSDFIFSEKNWSRLFVIWLLITSFIAIYNKDWSALRILLPWALIISSMVVLKFPFKLSHLNIFFAISIISSVVGYHLNLSQFGYILGQSKWNCFSLDRVSLYPSLFDSAYISFVVLIFNYFYNSSKTRFLILLISFYFIIFSANRTVYLCLAVFLAFILIRKFPKEKFFLVFGCVATTAFALLIIIMIYPEILGRSQVIGNVPFIDKYVFHKSEHEMCDAREEQMENYSSWGKSNNRKYPYYHIYGRGELLRKMFTEFKKSPVLGTGHAYININGRLPDSAGGPESFLAGLLVRFGITSLLFLFSFILLAYYLFQKNAHAEFVLVLSTLIAWFLFGASASIYNFNFLLTMLLIFSFKSRTMSN